MIAKVYSTIPHGYNGQLVEVEGDANQGLPSFNIVGMANKTINEARERVRSAIVNSGFRFPTKKVTVNLAPAEVTKDGTHLDLPIALAILVISKQLLPGDISKRIFVGELSLNGDTKPIRGIINIVEAAKQAGYREVYLPASNLEQASLIKGVTLIGVKSLRELFLHLKGQKIIQTPTFSDTCPKIDISSKMDNCPLDKPTLNQSSVSSPPIPEDLPYFLDQIHGQSTAKRALTIAIAGHHNILLSGPPGTGKSLLARTAANLLPQPTQEEQVEIAKISSLISPVLNFPIKRPFRSPHHSASVTAMIGGGSTATPGEISLAHHGILFLDELPEFAKNVLESLRQPLEDHQISVARAHAHTVYPANFILFATMNPCPCGFYGDQHHTCTCQPRQIQIYRTRLSGPIHDRIDLHIDVKRVPTNQLLETSTHHSEHDQARRQISKATKIQQRRYKNLKSHHIFYNGLLTPADIKRFVQVTPSARDLLQTASDKLSLSTRAYFKTLKVAQTIADLDNAPKVDVEQISEALSYRQRITC